MEHERRRTADRVKPLLAMIIIVGVWLSFTSTALLYTTWSLAGKVDRANDEVQKNREVGCISRYLDRSRYAPDCQQYIDRYVESQ